MRWILAAAVALVVWGVLRLFGGFTVRRFARLAGRTGTRVDDMLAGMLAATKTAFLLLFALYLGSRLLALPPRAERILQVVTITGLLLQVGVWIGAALTILFDRFRSGQTATDRDRVTTLTALSFASRLLLWGTVLLLVLANVGVNVTALVAGLGVTGIAVALAAQTVLADLFASVAIVLDKPFVLGDFLVINGYMGNVEHIGIKTTRLRSLSGEQLIFSNADLLGSRIRNFQRMSERRVEFSIGVQYSTPREKLRRIPALIRETVEGMPRTRFDRSHFSAYGSSALQFDTVYFVLDPSFNLYMDTQQEIYLRLHEALEREGIALAQPTITAVIATQMMPAGPTSGDAAAQEPVRKPESRP